MRKGGLPAPRSSEVEVNGAIAQLSTFGGNGMKSVKERKRAWLARGKRGGYVDTYVVHVLARQACGRGAKGAIDRNWGGAGGRHLGMPHGALDRASWTTRRTPAGEN